MTPGCPRDKPRLSFGTNRVFLLILQRTPRLSLGQMQFVPGISRGQRAAAKVYVFRVYVLFRSLCQHHTQRSENKLSWKGAVFDYIKKILGLLFVIGTPTKKGAAKFQGRVRLGYRFQIRNSRIVSLPQSHRRSRPDYLSLTAVIVL